LRAWLKDEESAQDNDVLACNFAIIFIDFNFCSLTDSAKTFPYLVIDNTITP